MHIGYSRVAADALSIIQAHSPFLSSSIIQPQQICLRDAHPSKSYPSFSCECLKVFIDLSHESNRCIGGREVITPQKASLLLLRLRCKFDGLDATAIGVGWMGPLKSHAVDLRLAVMVPILLWMEDIWFCISMDSMLLSQFLLLVSMMDLGAKGLRRSHCRSCSSRRTHCGLYGLGLEISSEAIT